MRLQSSQCDYPPYLLLVAHIDFIFEFLLRAAISVYPFRYENGLYRSVTEDHAGGEQAVYNGEEDLYYEVLATMSSTVCDLSIHTHSLPFRHLECAYRGLLSGGLSPCASHRIEAHFPVPRVRAGFATPWLDLLVRRDTLH